MTDCYCDFDPAELYNVTTRKARKQHRCEECRRVIEPGESYENVMGKWDGDINYFKTCSHCLDVRKFVQNSVPCFCWSHGNMLQDACDTIHEAYGRARDEIRGLFMGYGRLVIAGRRMRQAQRSLQPTQETR